LTTEGCLLDDSLRTGVWPDSFHVAEGKQTFSVKAADPSGNVDKSAAVVRFKRVKPHHHH
jgi:hypothetical protein